MATIADRSRTKEIIERLQMILDSAPSVPLATGKVSIYKDEVQSLLTELSSQMDMEIKTYHEVNDRKGKIISEAKKEAERIIFEAEHSASRMRVTKRTTDVSPINYNELGEEERMALGGANEIYAASLIYTDEMLTEVSEMIEDAYHNIRSDYEIILQVMEEKMNTLNQNRAELMDGLQEMDPDDRNQQMLEIGQLLSSELYNSRMNAKINPDEYQDGSIQLSLDLQEEQLEKTRQAEEKAQRAEEALAQMMAERDALAQKVEKMKSEGMRSSIPHKQPKESKPVIEDVYEEKEDTSPKKEDDTKQQDSMTEEEKTAKEKEVAEAIKELENLDKETEKIPLIPHFKKSEPVASVPAEKIAQMANAITTEKKYSGLIGRAVKQREQAQLNDTVKMVENEEVSQAQDNRKTSTKEPEVVLKDKDGKEYVQATMMFDDNFEITEF